MRGGKPPRHLAGLRCYHTKERNSPPPRAPTGWGLAEGGGPPPKVLWAWAEALGGLAPPAPAWRRRRTQGGGCAERAGPARWARFVSEAQPTPRGAGGPPLSRLGYDNGGVPKGSSIGARRACSVWGKAPRTFLGGVRGQARLRSQKGARHTPQLFGRESVAR